MPEHFHLVLEGGDGAYWQILRAMRDAGFEVVLDFEPEEPLSWRMTMRPASPLGLASAEEAVPTVEIPAPVQYAFTEEHVVTGIDFGSSDVHGLNMAALKRILREWLTAAIMRGDYTIAEAERLFAVLKLE